VLTEKRKMMAWAGIMSVPQLVACVMLLWALKPDNRYGYYTQLRWVCCVVFAYVAILAAARRAPVWLGILGSTAAVAYNPIIHVHLTRDIWSIINVITIGIAVASISSLWTRQSATSGAGVKAAHKATSRPPDDPFTVEHDRALDILRRKGWIEAESPEKERILADLAAAGFARKEGSVYLYTLATASRNEK
jgi:hypothetical protein